MKEEWKDKLRESMDGFEETAPDGLWSAVSEALGDKLPSAVGEGKSGNAAPLRMASAHRWVRAVAVAACFAGGAGLYLHLHNGGSDADGSTSARVPSPVADNDGYASESDGQPLLASADKNSEYRGSASADAPRSKCDAPYYIYKGTGDSDSNGDATDVGVPVLAGVAAQDNAAGDATADSEVVVASPSHCDGTSVVMSKTVHTRAVRHQQNSRPGVKSSRAADASGCFSASAFAMGNMVSSANDNGGMLLMSGSMSSPMFDSESGGGEEEVSSPPKVYLVPSCPEQTVRHRQPLRMGVSLRYALTPRVGVSTGLVYSRLSSDMTQNNVADRYVSNQRLHFIGVPLSVDYCVWSNRWLTFYASAGVMGEKCVDGKLSTEYVVNDRTVSVTEKDLDIDRLQWSVNGGVGMQLNILPQVGVYLEPGIDWHFGNGGNVKTVYTDKPLQPSLKFGMRYTINK